MTEDTDLALARAVLHEFDLGPLAPLDLDEVVRRGHRRRRTTAALRATAAAAVVVLAGTVAVTAHGVLGHTQAPDTSTSPTPTPTPTPSPSTAAERVTAAMNAIASAVSVHVVAREFPGGQAVLDVVVTRKGAVGTLTYQGKTAQYLGVGGQVYMKGDAVNTSTVPPLQDSQVAAAGGRWFLMTGWYASEFMNLDELSKSFYPRHGTTPTLGGPRTIDGTATTGLTYQNGGLDTYYLETGPPYRPVLDEGPNHVIGVTYSDWDGPAPAIPAAPDPADVYDPRQG